MSMTMRLLLARSPSTIPMRGINGARRRAFSNFCYDSAESESESESEFQWPIEKGEEVQSPPERPKMMMKESEMMKKKKKEETEEEKGTLSKELFKRPHEESVDKLKEGKERSSKTKELVTNDSETKKGNSFKSKKELEREEISKVARYLEKYDWRRFMEDAGVSVPNDSETKRNSFSDFRDSFKSTKELEIRKMNELALSEFRERMKESEIKKMQEQEREKEKIQERGKEINLSNTKSLSELREEIKKSMNGSEIEKINESEMKKKNMEEMKKKNIEETEEKIGGFRGWEIKPPPPGSRVAEGRSSGGPTQEKEGREEENALSDGDKSMFIHFMNAFTGICKTMSRNMELEHKYSMAKCMEAYRSIGDGFTPQEDLVVYRLFKVKDNREFFLSLEDWKRALWLRNMFTKK